jgi:hypothetical protein
MSLIITNYTQFQHVLIITNWYSLQVRDPQCTFTPINVKCRSNGRMDLSGNLKGTHCDTDIKYINDIYIHERSDSFNTSKGVYYLFIKAENYRFPSTCVHMLTKYKYRALPFELHGGLERAPYHPVPRPCKLMFQASHLKCPSFVEM